CQKYSNSPLTF
nr:immunoglobulin light chain junction region [Macaca mulatta]MOW09105.1 immunoglobulin light chain junction region [Macaca mulatta]MOW10844.1 immunoglobulin light chain junction region [Macaca mulatta]MOW12094.1 immunoglobulin light chain junction region [Macaca mulatta]MOW12120.1 immunoglobulin light chain junction region [Macaca mulatta]